VRRHDLGGQRDQVFVGSVIVFHSRTNSFKSRDLGNGAWHTRSESELYKR
jgi:hypothetical protein